MKPGRYQVGLGGVYHISYTLDTVGAMAKSVSDLAELSTIILEPHARQALGKDGFSSHLSKSFKGLKVGFLQPDQWRLPETLWKPDEESRAALVC
jgi:amidase